MEKITGDTVVLLSGGLDSTVLLHLVRRRLCAGAVHALSFDYGQRHSRELDCAREQAALAGAASHDVLDMSFLGGLLAGGTALVRGGAEVPDLDALSPEMRDQPPTYVPNRNMVLLSLAAAHAEAHGVSDVFYGAQAQDEYGYWDCTPAFVDRVNAVLALNRRDAVTVHAPLAQSSKAGNIRLGMELGVDFSKTWSCYRGGEHPCGTCPTCVERARAFAEVGILDPLLPASEK
jgi:7-cyano-7-deazaguanine synthase